MTTCRSCGREAPEGARFCAFCGAELTPAASREERKVVSVVFVDLVGHTARSEASDPEDVRALLAPYHARARVELERFGGTVEKFIGDAVMAVFGAPTAHEDDAERAVRAALSVRDAFAEEGLDVRIAVNTGEALVSLAARPESGEAMVAGDVVNTAARLQSAAPVNGVLAGEQTYRLTQRAIEYREAEPVAAKGKTEPITAWEAVSPRARHGIDATHRPELPLVGREAERRLLVDAIDRAARERALQVVTLVGVPGIGKSRLVWELYSELDERTGLVATWRQGRAFAYGGGAFGAIAEVVRAECGVLETDEPATAGQRLDDAIAALTTDESERAWLHRLLAPLIGAEAGEANRDEAFGAWQRFFELVAEQLPLVLVIEDLHWADEGTLDFVEYLADWSTDSALLVLCTARPELLERRPGWGGGRLNSQTLSLAPLDDTATAQLLANVLGRPVVDADTQQALLAQAGGNPLYAEEFARLVVETGTVAEMPPTVQGVIAARLDVLPSAEKTLLQDASVLGKQFWRGGVAALGNGAPDDLLLSLTRKELLRRARTSTLSGETEFTFRHALVRDVAYAQIPRAARAEKHLAAAEWIASTSFARPDMVAHHYVEALTLAEALGTETASLRERAAEALQAAGDRARSLGAYDESLPLYRRALELRPDDPALLMRAAESGSEFDNSGLAEAERARALYDERGDGSGAAEAIVVMAKIQWITGETAAASATIDLGVAAARESGADGVLAKALEEQARQLATGGADEDAVGSAEEALALAEKTGLEATAMQAKITIGTCRSRLGHEDGLELLEEVAAWADKRSDPRALFRSLNNKTFVLFSQGDLAGAMSTHERAAELLARFPMPRISEWLVANAASGALAAGEWAEASDLITRYDAIVRDRASYVRTMVDGVRVMIGVGRGEPGAIDALAETALAGRDFQRDIPSQVDLALLHGLGGRSGEAAALARELAEQPAASRNVASIVAASLGLLSALTGVDLMAGVRPLGRWSTANAQLARGEFEDAIATLDEMEARTGANLARMVYAERRARAGEDPDPWLEEARAFFDSVDARYFVRRLDELSGTAAAEAN